MRRRPTSRSREAGTASVSGNSFSSVRGPSSTHRCRPTVRSPVTAGGADIAAAQQRRRRNGVDDGDGQQRGRRRPPAPQLRARSTSTPSRMRPHRVTGQSHIIFVGMLASDSNSAFSNGETGSVQVRATFGDVRGWAETHVLDIHLQTGFRQPCRAAAPSPGPTTVSARTSATPQQRDRGISTSSFPTIRP